MMRDENSQRSPGGDALSEQQQSADGANGSRRDGEARTDPPNVPRWVPLAYDLEQNGDSSSDYRGEVF
jgi:hypothetical protein